MGRILNKPTPTIINTELRPFDESFHIETNGQTEQWFYDNTSQYAPDRAITPLILSPVLSVFDAEEQKSYSTEITDIAEEGHLAFNYVSWYVLEYNATTGQYTESEVTATENGQNVYYIIQGHNLIVKKNVSYEHGVTVRCKACYIDPRDAGVTYIVEETLVLSTNRDATVILPEVDIISPSARAFNPLTDYDEQGSPLSEFEFDGVVKNSPDVERVTSSDLAEYKVDGWGTEEIESASGSCSPTLTIRYPDGSIETDARFMYRRTADGNKLDMGGKVISWNQLVRNGDFSNGTSNWNYNSTVDTMSVSEGKLLCTTTSANANVYVTTGLSTVVGHKYYAVATLKSSITTGASRFTTNTSPNVGGRYSFSLQANVEKRVATIIEQTTAGTLFGIYHNFSTSAPPPVGSTLLIDNVMFIDLTTIYGSGKEPTSVAQFESDYQMWFGKQLTYEPYDAGSQRQTFAPQNAFITNIKGETIAWNQIIPYNTPYNNVPQYFYSVSVQFTSTAGHKLYVNFEAIADSDVQKSFVIGGGSSFLTPIITANLTASNYQVVKAIRSPNSTGNMWLKTADKTSIAVSVRNQMVIDLTLIYGVGNEPTTTAAFEADYLKWFGKPLTYESYDAGSLKPVKMLSMKTVGFNAADYDEMKVGSENYAYSYNGYYCKSFKLLPNTTYRIRKKASSYGSVVLLINSDSAINSGNYFDTRSSSSFSKDYTTNSSGLLYVGVVSGTSAQVKARLEEIDLQIYLINDDSRNGHYESHWHNKSMLNVNELKGRVVTNGQATGNLVTIFPNGMKRAMSVYDEIYVENGKIYAIKRVNSVDMGTLTWQYSAPSDHIFRDNTGNHITDIKRPDNSGLTGNYAISGRYMQKAYSPLKASDDGYFAVAPFVSSNKPFVIIDHNYSTIEAFKAALSGMYFYYEIANPIIYEIDEIQSPFIFKWFGINSSGQEVDATTMPWYKEGQDTSKLKVDAMYGENINVVLRCTKGAGLNELSPSKAYAAVAWKVPDVDTHVVSYNGGAVRNGTGDMEFGTIINVNGNVLPDTVKNAHLRFNWKYRHSTSTTVNDAGWGSTIDIARSTLMHVRSVVGAALASTHVYPEVYLLGAWKPATSTTTPYDKPTTTKDGTSYERTID